MISKRFLIGYGSGKTYAKLVPWGLPRDATMLDRFNLSSFHNQAIRRSLNLFLSIHGTKKRDKILH